MKKISLIALAAFIAVSCTKDIENLNENTKDPTQVDGESLFASAEKALADQMLTPNVNYNNNRLWVQHWQETTYPDESNYDQGTRTIPDNHWRVMYRDVLKNLKRAGKLIDEEDNALTNDQKPNKLAIIEILKVYTYSNLVETFGDVPYSEALDIDNTLPAFDDGETVYKDLIDRLNDAIESMDDESAFAGDKDLIYSGDPVQWKKFANTLKLRMGMVLADVDPSLSQTTVEEAYQSGVFDSNADDAEYKYDITAPNNNPVNNELILSGRHDYVAAETIIGIMNDLKDPRRAGYFAPNINETVGEIASVSGSTITFVDDIDVPSDTIVGNPVYVDDGSDQPPMIGVVESVGSNSIDVATMPEEAPEAGAEVIYAIYTGGPIGKAAPESNYATNTHTNQAMTVADRPGPILTYVESEFLLAEAGARNYSVGGDAETHYEAAITASFDEWGITGVADYLSKPEVDYTQATANASWKEVIGTQEWIGLYGRSFAPYLSVRRLDYPLLTEPYRAESGFPVRYTYPVSEQNLNSDSWSAAASAIGGDEPETQLFWDTDYNFNF